jgi:WD40 repeat protein
MDPSQSQGDDQSATPSPLGANPYVGPRPFKIGQPIFGREREIVELDHLLSAERIVLLYSPSGAGKSSLVNAGLIPRLDWHHALAQGLPAEGRFDVWRPTRVNQDPGGLAVQNRFVWSAAVGLESEIPEEFGPRAPEALAGLTLKECVEGRRRRIGAPRAVLLIFDQFEEVLRIDPLGVAEKEAFFDQLGELLQDPWVWGLFCLREDYLAALDPYSRRLPTHLNTRYRIDRLALEPAAEAIDRPTLDRERRFAPGVVERLVNDLAQVKVQQPDGSFRQQTGLHVEPIHLQVVCYGLWERMDRDKLVIDDGDLAAFGNVGNALSHYYASAVQAVAAGNTARERRIRDWFEDRLIAPDGVRRQVLHGKGESEGLPNSEIALLTDSYLIRAEPRAGATWYELAHDRLIRPVQEDNTAWRDAHLSDLQRAAILWERGGRGEGLQLSGPALDEAQRWASEHDAELTGVERAFLEASLETRQRVQRARQAEHQRRMFHAAIAVIALVTAGMLTILHFYFQARDERARAERAETVSRLGAQAALDFGPRPGLGLLLAVQRARAIREAGHAPLAAGARELLRYGLSIIGGVPLGQQAETGKTLAFSPNGNWVATGGGADVWLWKVAGGPPTLLRGQQSPIVRLAFAPDSARLASAASDGGVQLWDLRVEGPRSPLGRRADHTDYITDLAFDPKGRWLATASYDHKVRLWSLDSDRVLTLPHPHMALAVAFSPDGAQLATGGVEPTISLWDLAAGDPSAAPARLENDDQVNRLAFSPDGRWLVAGRGKSYRFALWDRSQDNRRCLTPINQWPTVITFSPDNRWMASPNHDQVLLWDLARPDPCADPIVLTGHRSLVTDLVFSPDGETLATASLDGTARLWSMANLHAAPTVLRGHQGSVFALAFGADSVRLATAGEDRMPRLWRLPVAAAEPEVLQGAGHPGDIQLWRATGGAIDQQPIAVGDGSDSAAVWAAFSPDGRWLASYASGDLVKLWRTADLAAPPIELHHEGAELWATPVFSPDDHWLATGDTGGALRLVGALRLGGALRLWDLSADDPAVQPRQWRAHRRPIRELQFSGDGQWLVSGSNDRTATVWDIAGSDPPVARFILRGHGDVVRTLAISPNKHWVLTGSWDHKARLWDLASAEGEQRPRILPFDDRLFAVAFSPDGRWAAAGSWDRSVQLVDLRRPGGAPLVLHHGARVLSVAFSPDSHWLATGSEDQTARLWDLTAADPTGAPAVLNVVGLNAGTVSFDPHGRWLSVQAGEFRAQPFSPDGRLVATFGNERLLFHLQTDDLVDLACKTAGRNLTLEEWRQFLGDQPYRATCPSLPAP